MRPTRSCCPRRAGKESQSQLAPKDAIAAEGRRAAEVQRAAEAAESAEVRRAAEVQLAAEAAEAAEAQRAVEAQRAAEAQRTAEAQQAADIQAARVAEAQRAAEFAETSEAQRDAEAQWAATPEVVPKATPVAAADGLDVLKNKADAVEAATKQIEGIATIVESKITELEAKKREVRQAVLIKEAELKIGVTSKQRLEVQEQGNIDTNALKVERTRFETVIKDRLEPVQLEELEDAVAKKHAHSLQDIARKLSLDEALLASLPKAVTTANPIRKVVNMLDALKSKVERVGEK